MQHIHLKIEPKLDKRLQAFAYQAEAVNAVRDLDFAAVFHEQGLGKTKIALDIILYWLETRAIDTALLIVKKGLVANWVKEIKTHTYITPRLITQDRRANYYAFNSPARLMLTHYEAMKAERERFRLFLKARSVGVILDESAKIKNPESEVTKVLFDLASLMKKRVIMTGTPVANRPYDIWAQIWFLDQGKALGQDFGGFKSSVELTNDLWDDLPAQQQLEKKLDGIFKKITSFCVRETKARGVITLPDKVIKSLPAIWETRQYELYRQLRDDLHAVVVKEGIPKEENAESILKRLLRLVQVASNPKLVDESYNANPGKQEVVIDLVGRIRDAGEKCIVWTSFTENVDWLSRELRVHGACRVHGKLTMEERNKAVERFLSVEDCRVLIATPGAAKEGLTLTVANHVIFYDRSFSLDDYLQAQDRIHRISQKKTCHVYNLIMKNSIDEWVDILLHSKQLAAQLAQGDISLEFYKSQMSYEFGDVLRGILGIDGRK
ncbi:MAG: DEAD/DEAH box helicase [Dehalococcoidales bacterium]|nr:DEAD/DEAH box helicase [Dehalococcoidales bacterium]